MERCKRCGKISFKRFPNGYCDACEATKNVEQIRTAIYVIPFLPFIQMAKAMGRGNSELLQTLGENEISLGVFPSCKVRITSQFGKSIIVQNNSEYIQRYKEYGCDPQIVYTMPSVLSALGVDNGDTIAISRL